MSSTAKQLFTLVTAFAILFLVQTLSSQTLSGQTQTEVTFSVTGVEQGDVLNVRAAPTVKSDIALRLPPNASGITRTGKEQLNGRTTWVEVSKDGVTGWVNIRYLKQSQTAPTAHTAATDTATGGEAILGKRVALVIGNGRYQGGITPLANAANDGIDTAAALRATGFEVIELIDADLTQIVNGLNLFATKASGAEIAMFFFAGHGMQINGENYLLPVSAQIAKVEDVRSQTFSLSEIMNAFQKASPSLSILVLDACRNNPATQTVAQDARSRGLSGIKPKQGLARRSGLPGMMVVYSTDPDNVASDGSDRNSPFTKALLKEIEEPEVEVRLMFGSVREHVVRDTQGAQTPFVEEAVLGRYFFKPPPEIRRDLFFGRWAHEHFTLKVDATTVDFQRPPYMGAPPEILSKATCGDVYERSYQTMQIDKMKDELDNPRIEKWARQNIDAKTVRYMRVVCAYGTNRYYFFLQDGRNMLATRFSEMDWLMFEGVYKEPE